MIEIIKLLLHIIDKEMGAVPRWAHSWGCILWGLAHSFVHCEYWVFDTEQKMLVYVTLV